MDVGQVSKIASATFRQSESKINTKEEKQNKEIDTYSSKQTFDVETYNETGKITSATSDFFSKDSNFMNIQDAVSSQVDALMEYYGEQSAKSPIVQKANENLQNYLDSNPDAAKEISEGNVPDHWNKENTAKRIFDLAIEGQDESEMGREEIYDRAVNMVEQAYREVQQTVPKEFPQLVLETREAILEGLEKFRQGADTEEISFA